MHNKNDKKTYIDDKNIFFSFNNWTISIEKVEKVVNEPNNPIIKKYLINIGDPWFFSIELTNKPIKKEPEILTNSVPIGKLG